MVFVRNKRLKGFETKCDKKTKLNGDPEQNRKHRKNLPKESVKILKQWLVDHRDYPYPSEDVKFQLHQVTLLTPVQVDNWFINARRRILPKLDGNNPGDFKISQRENTKVPDAYNQPINDLDKDKNKKWNSLKGTQPRVNGPHGNEQKNIMFSEEDSLDDYVSSNSGNENTISSPSTPGTSSPVPEYQDSVIIERIDNNRNYVRCNSLEVLIAATTFVEAEEERKRKSMMK